MDFFLLSIELAYRELLVLDITGHLTQSQGEALEIVCQCFVIIKELERLGHRQLQDSSAPIDSMTLVHTSAVGRPMYDIPDHSLELLLEIRFTVPQISSLFGVSISTIRRQMRDYLLGHTIQQCLILSYTPLLWIYNINIQCVESPNARTFIVTRISHSAVPYTQSHSGVLIQVGQHFEGFMY